jgi:hypothetical protein
MLAVRVFRMLVRVSARATSIGGERKGPAAQSARPIGQPNIVAGICGRRETQT